jgi:hypothetical protein
MTVLIAIAFGIADTHQTMAQNVTGSGTIGNIPKWTGTSALTDSVMSENNGKIGIGGTPVNRLHLFIPNTAANDGLALDGTVHPGITFKSSGVARVFIGLATGPNGWVLGAATNDLVIRTEDGTNGNILFATQSGGKFPLKLFHNGDAAVDGNLTVTGNVAAKYQDVAEWVPTRQALPAGTVVVLDSELPNHVVSSTRPYDTRVAGVVSDKPGVILGEGGEGKVKVATTGRVKVWVDATQGAIKIGDLLVTSGQSGIAMRSAPVDLGGTLIHRPGTIIGKALEPLGSGVGEILVLLSLQ